jgi:phosphatidylserine/phosphatidylglycerophosphate/cardiolipin synthase-like enzyme
MNNESVLESFSQVKVFKSLDNHFAISDNLGRALTKTRKQLLISSPWLGKGFIDLMRRTVPNGVSIFLVTRLPSENFENSFDAINSLCDEAKLHDWTIDIRCTAKHHPKFFVIDDVVCVAGSLNPTESGMYYNIELGFTITIPEVIDVIISFFHKMRQRSIVWAIVKEYNGFESNFGRHDLSRLAEKYINVLISNGNAPLPKWKICSQLKSQGFDERDIINVQKTLSNQGILYEPKTDWVSMTSAE